MHRIIIATLLVFMAGATAWAESCTSCSSCESGSAGDLGKYLAARVAEFDQIPAERKKQLEQLTSFIRSRVKAEKPVSLTFVCTRNSRRSHMSQIWAGTAAVYYRIPRVHTYSGGTGSTAFNPRAVAAIRRAGFAVIKTTDDQNPVYHVFYSPRAMPFTCFSKVYNHAPNPKKDFCAVMTCDAAAKACPDVEGAADRVMVTYKDPKAFDGTDKEAQAYDERCAQIAREQLYLFSRVNAE